MRMYLLACLILLVAPNLQAGEKTFWILTAANYASTVADIELTQNCLHNNVCREGNPLMPSDRKKAYPIQLGISTAFNIISYKLMKSGNKHWYLPQVAIVSAHGVGITFGLRFQF